MFKGNVGQSDSTYNHSYQSHPSQLAEDEALSKSLENMNFGTAAGNKNVSYRNNPFGSNYAEYQGSINPDRMSYEVPNM
nr:hypothetical protein CFP56_44827 [Quercus suber]